VLIMLGILSDLNRNNRARSTPPPSTTSVSPSTSAAPMPWRYMGSDGTYKMGGLDGQYWGVWVSDGARDAGRLVLVLGYCGLRFGEVAALRVGDVNLAARRIRVSRSVTNVTGMGLVEGATKNHTARTVPVPKFLVSLLETEIGERADTELLFGSRRGGYLTVGEVRWVFDPAAEAVGQDGLTPHELRHTCASLAIAAGANVKVLQTLLGARRQR
jgi:integrase